MGLRDALYRATWAFMGRKGIGGLDMLLGADAKSWYPKTDFERLSKEGYEYNAVIYACINELMDSLSEAPILVEVQNRKGEWEVKPDHELARLLARPNPDMSVDDFTRAITMYQAIAGNMFWEKERSGAGRVVGLWPMRPDRVGIVSMTSKPGERVKQRILNYTWRHHADVVRLPASDVIHFKEPNPRDELFGLPPLAAGAREGDIDNRATNYVGSFFDNAAVPKGLLKVQGRIDPAEEKRLKERLERLFSGRAGWHDPLILGEGSEWTELAESFKDMDFPNLRKITETRLCMIFDVPPIIIGSFAGLERGTYANYGQARQSYTQETVIPMYRRRDTVLNRMLAPEFGKGVRVRSDTSKLAAMMEDMHQIWTRAREAFTASGITRNEFREQVGVPKVVGGDVFLQPLMMSEIPAVVEGQKAVTIRSESKMANHVPEDNIEVYYKAFDTVARAWESPFRKKARELFQQELEEILKILRKEGKASIEGEPFHKFLDLVVAYLIQRKEAWQTAFLPVFTELTVAQGDNVLGALGIAWDIQQPEVQEFLHAYTIKFADKIEDTTERAVRGLVATAQDEGWSVPTLRGEIDGLFDEFDKQRADNIARTETIRSSNAGTHEAWRMAGIERTQWYASIDGRQCAFCEWMHKEYGPGTAGISITENYVSLGDTLEVDVGEGKTKSTTITYSDVQYPPLHNKCRCTILAIVE